MKRLKAPYLQPLKEETATDSLKAEQNLRKRGRLCVVHKSFLYKEVKAYRKQNTNSLGDKEPNFLKETDITPKNPVLTERFKKGMIKFKYLQIYYFRELWRPEISVPFTL